MIDVVTVENAHHYGDALASQFRLRHRVFIERERYDVPSYQGMEYDQFDTPAAVYLVRRDRSGEARAVTRLLPTTRPYMINSLWPHLLDEAPPQSQQIWEATRLGCDYDLDPATRDRYIGEIIAGCIEYGLHAGIKGFLCVMPTSLLKRVLIGSGCDIDLLGQPSAIGRFPVIAGRLNVTAESLAAIRARKGLTGDVLNIAGGSVPFRRAA